MKPKRRSPSKTQWKNKQRQITKGALIRKFLTGGTPPTQIAKQTGLSESRINQIKRELKKQGIQIPEYKKTQLNSKQKKTIENFLLGGTPNIQIAKQTGLSESRISEIKRELKKQGIQIPEYEKTQLNSKQKKTIENFLLGGTPIFQIVKQTGLSESRINQIKTKLKKQGIQIPKYEKTQWKNSKGRILKRNQRRKTIIESPTKKTIKQYTQQLKVSKATMHTTIEGIKKDNKKLIRQGLKPFKIQIKSGHTKPIPKLTPTQQKLLNSIQPIIKQTINKTAGKFKLNPDEITDLNQQTQIKMHRWIHEHNPTKIGRPIIRLIINNQTADFNRIREQQQTGLSRLETKIGRKIEAFMDKETNKIQQQKQRKILPEEEQQILQQAIQTVNNTPDYTKQMKISTNKFPQKKLTLKEAQQILNARTTAKKQKNTHDRNEK